MPKLLYWWHLGLIGALSLSLALLGVGRLDFFASGVTISAWSVSRTTAFFWIILKVLIAVHERRLRLPIHHWAIFRPLSVFFLVVTVSLLPDFRAAGDYRYFVFACVHAVMLVDVLTDKQRLRWTMLSLGILPAILVMRGFVNAPAILSIDLAHRFGFPLDHPHTAGFVLAVTVPLGLWCVTTEKGWRRGLAAISCLLQLLALILTFSRGAWVGAALSLLGYAILRKQWKPVVIVFGLFLVALWAIPALRVRLLSLAKPQQDVAISERMMLANEATRLGIDNPVLGVGYGRGRLKEALRGRLRGTEYEHKPIWHTHNLYVELFAGTGLLGLGAFLWMAGAALICALRSAWHPTRPDALLCAALASSWIAVLSCGFGDVPFFHHETRILLFTLLGLIGIVCREGGGQREVAA